WRWRHMSTASSCSGELENRTCAHTTSDRLPGSVHGERATQRTVPPGDRVLTKTGLRRHRGRLGIVRATGTARPRALVLYRTLHDRGCLWTATDHGRLQLAFGHLLHIDIANRIAARRRANEEGRLPFLLDVHREIPSDNCVRGLRLGRQCFAGTLHDL